MTLDFVIATKLFPTVAMEPLPSLDPNIPPIKLTTEPMSFTTKHKAFG